ncbi:ribbon-helix-helix domain-containing protein [Acidocella aromatica]|uniref:Putative DNA-binding ribbon-helix-helix protein n=1 Tax=Acidocella aromatica TaxID=1303579 RepID=A0A840VCR6_9PROT|nr:ribbon-helix-helix domain-containing protein [Acidocella aromatica]MBB5372647.1 putative DNA-binding ribbon-helix-helix protein [Acidocella aromatica]
MLDKRSFSLSGHRTSVALEPEFWAALGEIAQAAGEPLSALITRIDAKRAEGQPLASALRVFALKEKL